VGGRSHQERWRDWKIRAVLFVLIQVIRVSGSDTLIVRDGRRSFGASLRVWSFCKAGSVPSPTCNLQGYGKRMYDGEYVMNQGDTDMFLGVFCTWRLLVDRGFSFKTLTICQSTTGFVYAFVTPLSRRLKGIASKDDALGM
jgi:hypothetical protein